MQEQENDEFTVRWLRQQVADAEAGEQWTDVEMSQEILAKFAAVRKQHDEIDALVSSELPSLQTFKDGMKPEEDSKYDEVLTDLGLQTISVENVYFQQLLDSHTFVLSENGYDLLMCIKRNLAKAERLFRSNERKIIESESIIQELLAVEPHQSKQEVQLQKILQQVREYASQTDVLRTQFVMMEKLSEDLDRVIELTSEVNGLVHALNTYRAEINMCKSQVPQGLPPDINGTKGIIELKQTKLNELKGEIAFVVSTMSSML